MKIQVELRDPGSLIPYAKNAKVHSRDQIDKIAGQIAAFGFDQPIVVDKDGVVIKGHGRREAALKLGLKEVPVIVAAHLDEYQAMAARIADNKVADAPWDTDLLKFDLGTLSSHEFNMKLTGFELPDLGNFLSSNIVSPEMFGGPKTTSESDPTSPPEEKKEAVGAKEYGEEQFSEFEHKCPRCGFEFDDGSMESEGSGEDSEERT
jgi:hypothetical protein